MMEEIVGKKGNGLGNRKTTRRLTFLAKWAFPCAPAETLCDGIPDISK